MGGTRRTKNRRGHLSYQSTTGTNLKISYKEERETEEQEHRRTQTQQIINQTTETSQQSNEIFKAQKLYTVETYIETAVIQTVNEKICNVFVFTSRIPSPCFDFIFLFHMNIL